MQKLIFMLLMICTMLSSISANNKAVSIRFIDYHGYQLCEKTSVNPKGDTIVLYGIYRNGKEIISAHYDSYDYSFSLNAILLIRTKDNSLELSIFDNVTNQIVWKQKFLNITIKGFKDIAQNRATLDIIGPKRAIKEWQQKIFIRRNAVLECIISNDK